MQKKPFFSHDKTFFSKIETFLKKPFFFENQELTAWTLFAISRSKVAMVDLSQFQSQLFQEDYPLSLSSTDISVNLD